MSKLQPGTKVSDFSLPMTGGGTWRLRDAAGSKLVIFFYPRDMTTGCTRESQDFRDLADTDETVCKLFDVIRPKSLYGRKFLGVERSTFLLDGAGRLLQEWRKVKVPGHAEAVLEAAQRQ
jgi:peroxiredoxin Q/BCP